MTDVQHHDGKASTENGDAVTRGQLEQLRDLLLAPEQQKLSELSQRVDERAVQADDVSHVLPEAVRRASARNDSLARSLGPTISNILQTSIKRNPRSIVDAISPIMGPAIRQSIRQTIQGMLQSFNQALEHSFSWQGLRWRWEAWRTGKPFAEVVLIKTLIYRIEQIFLIDRETGLLLAHEADPALGQLNTDVISSMLTAIQDFVRDSFQGDRDDVVDAVRWRGEDAGDASTGYRSFWVETGPQALLVAVIRGTAPQTVRERMCETLESIHIDFASALDGFQGDSGPFASAQEYLAECLLNEFRVPERKQTNPVLRWLPWAITASLAIVAVVWFGRPWYQRHRLERHVRQLARRLDTPDTVQLTLDKNTLYAEGKARQKWLVDAAEAAGDLESVERIDISGVTNLDAAWIQLLDRLRREEGITVTSAEICGDEYHLQGLRDPLAMDLATVVQEVGLDSERLVAQWTMIESLDAAMILARARRVLSPPPTVDIHLDNGTVHLTGSACGDWIRRAILQAGALSGVRTVDASRLDDLDAPWHGYLARLREEPGIVVVESGRRDDRYFLSGLRDPLARDPEDLLESDGVIPDQMDTTWKPYVSMDDVIVQRRLAISLDVPPGVTLAFAEGILTVTGAASHDWIVRLQAAADESAAITKLDTSLMVDVELERIQPIRKAIEDRVIYYDVSKSDVRPDQVGEIDALIDDLQTLLDEARGIDKQARIDIEGHASSDEGDNAQAVPLSEMRAKRLWQTLVKRGIPGNIFVTKGAGLRFAPSPAGIAVGVEAQRRVTFRVRLGHWDP